MKVKRIEKLSIREDTGCLTIKDPDNNHNFAIGFGVFVKNSADGRGSQIDTIGGNSQGFTELQDIYYFARKLYRSLKYPLSRVTSHEEKQESQILFGGSSVGEITRDEIKWAKFLEKQQKKFTNSFEEMFLLHLDFKGLKNEYGLTRNDININMKPPSDFKEQMRQNFYESRFNNYQIMADRPEMSKYYLMKKFLKWSDEEIEENVKGMKKDKTLGFKEESAF